MPRLLAAVALLACAVGAAGIDSVSPAGGDASACRPAPAVRGVTEGQSIAGTVAPSTGTLRAALLLVHAADVPPDASVSPPEQMINAADAWYRAVSYGRLGFRVETTPRWLRLPGSSDEYRSDPARYLADAVGAADPFVDFSQIDVVYLAPAQRTPGPTPVSAILNSLGVRADGVEIGFWVPFDPGFAESDWPGGLLHETGHLLGLPDLYVAGTLRTFHRWDVMTDRWPAELLAWHRWKLGWLDPGQILCVTGSGTRVVTLTPIERPGGLKAVFVRRGKQVLALEVRSRAGYDAAICERGVLAYEVDQTPFRRAPVHIHQARPDVGRVGPCGAQWNAPFDIGRGETRALRLSDWRFQLRLLTRLADGSYRLRVTTQ